MARFHVHDFKKVSAGGDLGAASAIPLHEDAIDVNMEEQTIEEIRSTSPLPVNVYKIGTDYEATATPLSSSLDDLATALDATNSTGITITAKESNPQKKDKYDIQYKVALPSDAASSQETWEVTNVIFQGNMDEQFQADEGTYVPFNIRGTSETTISINQS